MITFRFISFSQNNNLVETCKKEELSGLSFSIYEGGNKFDHEVEFLKLVDDGTFVFQVVGSLSTEIIFSAGFWQLKDDSLIVLNSDFNVHFNKLLNDTTLIYSGKHNKTLILENYIFLKKANCLVPFVAEENLSFNEIIDTTQYFEIKGNNALINHVGVVQHVDISEFGVTICIDYGKYFGWFLTKETSLIEGQEILKGEIILNVLLGNNKPYIENKFVIKRSIKVTKELKK